MLYERTTAILARKPFPMENEIKRENEEKLTFKDYHYIV